MFFNAIWESVDPNVKSGLLVEMIGVGVELFLTYVLIAILIRRAEWRRLKGARKLLVADVFNHHLSTVNYVKLLPTILSGASRSERDGQEPLAVDYVTSAGLRFSDLSDSLNAALMHIQAILGYFDQRRDLFDTKYLEASQEYTGLLRELLDDVDIMVQILAIPSTVTQPVEAHVLIVPQLVDITARLQRLELHNIPTEYATFVRKFCGIKTPKQFSRDKARLIEAAWRDLDPDLIFQGGHVEVHDGSGAKRIDASTIDVSGISHLQSTEEFIAQVARSGRGRPVGFLFETDELKVVHMGAAVGRRGRLKRRNPLAAFVNLLRYGVYGRPLE